MQNTAFSSPKPPHFFKVILAEALADGKIGIPRRYVERHGSELLDSNAVLLKLPDGKKWKMGILKKSDGTIWIETGWNQFALHYHLSHGSFLVFQKDVSCSFEVTIFDLSATEIDYPCPIGNKLREKSSKKQGGDVVGNNIDSAPLIVNHDAAAADSVEIIGGTSNPVRKSQVPSSLKAGQNCMEKNEGGETMRNNDTIRKGDVINEVERTEECFKSNNPFFKIGMRPSYANRLVIPAQFVRNYASILRSGENACLCVASVGAWKVIYNVTFCNNKMHPAFRRGWSKFVRDNSLKVGDVCVFELVCPSKLMFEVTINRA